MSTSSRIIKNTIFLNGKIIVTSICLLLSTRYVLAALGVEDFGIYSLICSVVVMLSFLNESMTSATQRFMSYTEGEGNNEKCVKIFNSSYIVHIGIAVLIAIVFLFLEPIVFGSYLKIAQERLFAAKVIYFLTIATTALSMMTVPYNAVLVAHENMLYYSFIGSLNGILKLAAAIGVLFVPTDRLITYSTFLLLIGVLEFTICRVYCHKKYSECKVSLRKNVDKHIIKDMFSFAGWQLTYSASSIISIQGMSLILNSFFGSIMNAAQGIARQVCGQMMTLSGTLMSAINPVIVKSAGAKNQENMIRIVMTGSKMSYLLVVVLAFPVLFEIPYLLNLWLTEVPEYAIMFCRYEVAQQIIASFTVTLVTMISGVGDIKSFQIFSSATYIFRLPLIYLMLRIFDNPEHAYWIATAAVVILCIGRIYYAEKKCGLPVMPYITKVILPCILASIIVLIFNFIIISFIQQSFCRMCIILCVSVITLGLSAYFFVFNENERKIINNTMKKVAVKFHRQ